MTKMCSMLRIKNNINIRSLINCFYYPLKEKKINNNHIEVERIK